MCMPDNKNITKCRMPVWKLAQPRTSTATHRRVPDWRMPGPKNLINAGIQVIERTPGDKSIKIMCMRVDKNKINDGCRFPNQHSHTPDPACAGSENTGSNEINKWRY